MLKEIEELRKHCKRIVTGTNLFCVFLVVVSIIFDLMSTGLHRYSFYPIIVLVMFVVSANTSSRQSAIYVDEFRNAFLNQLFDKRINLSFVGYGKGIDRYDMKEWGVIVGADHCFTRDLIEGSCLGTDFRMSFVQASKDHEIYGQNMALPQQIQIFNGCYLMVKLHGPVKGRVYVSSDSLEVLRLEEKTFESVFNVRCENCDAAEVLSTAMKEKMLKICLKQPSVFFGIMDGWLHMAIPGYTSLAAPSLSSEVNPALIERMEKQFRELNDLILWACEGE